MTDFTLLLDKSSFAVHNMHDITGKEALTTDYYYWQAMVGGKQKIKHASLSVMRSWVILDTVSFVVHCDTLREMKQSIVVSDAYWSFPKPLNALHIPGWAIIRLISCSLITT